MTDNPTNLDEHRGMHAQRDTEVRRRLAEVQADQAALHARKKEFENFLLSEPAKTWTEAAAKARYLINLYAHTVDAQDSTRQQLIASTLNDLADLSGQLSSTENKT